MKYAVVAGATKGIGRAIAERFLKEGYFVIGNYGHDDKAAEEMLKENRTAESRLCLWKQPLSSCADACLLAEKIRGHCDRLNVLVCNSGTTDYTPFPEVTPEDWARVIETNLTAPAFLIQKLLPVLAAQEGRVIMVGSCLGRYPHARSVSYGVSKAGIHALTKYLVKYLSPDGVTINCIAPGTIETSWHKEKTSVHRKRIEDKIALHRFGEPEEVAELCMAIICNQYLNGAIISLDGGYSYQ